MSYLYSALKAKEKELLSLLKQSQAAYNSNMDQLIVSSMRGHPHYRSRSATADSSRQTSYIPQKDLPLVTDLAQNDYLAQLIPTICRQLSQVKRLLNSYDPHALTDIYDHLHPARKTLVIPLLLSDEIFISQWKAVTYEGCPIDFGTDEHYTESGIRVRSKSEIIIGDRLDWNEIPYRYEYPLVVAPNLTLYPDFTVLNPRTREIYYWEHLGRMDDPDYVSRALYKLNCYNSIGILTGKNLILTMESQDRSLNARTVVRIIEDCLS